MLFTTGPVMWVTPLSAFPTPVPSTASYYTVPRYYVPPAAPIEPVTCGMPVAYGVPITPVMYEPSYYAPVAAPSLPRGEYRFGRCFMICQ